ncbi:hypothetical protein BK120_22985 [Paenibacillus sp. FSL A5-0031]|uniref:hypothetical protein n=1 Tax=Paenibacillus sp. FSL A5-0031 TaxID=1920420 RepID=UPI00096D3263|nr:hypothetical protein [Paenibacillus sp. FSL A5-0031]OME78606.1 hypothetical protein BK120_22985 [Paenibacillus sp. FSL A5-0031]
MSLQTNAETFERIIDHVVQGNPFKNGVSDLRDLYKYYRVQPKHPYSFSIEEIEEALVLKMLKRLSLISSSKISENIEDLEKYYLYRHLKFKDEVERNWNHLQTLSEFLKRSRNRVDEEKQMKPRALLKIVVLSVRINQLREEGIGSSGFFDIDKVTRPDFWRYAETVLYLESHVQNAVIEDGILRNRDEVASILFNQIENRIIRYGALNFLDFIQLDYKSTFDASFGMFDRSRNLARKFLYYIGIKVLTSSKTLENHGKHESLHDIVTIANVLLNMYDYRIDKPFQFMFVEDPITYLEKTIRHDALYKDYQYPPESTITLLDHILDAFRKELIEAIGLDKETFILISYEIFQYALASFSSKDKLPRLTLDELTRRMDTKASRGDIIRYLDSMASQTALNVKFNHPLEVGGISSDSEFLVPIPLGSHEYLMPNPSIAVFGLYDKTLSLLRFPTQRWGDAFEEFIQRWMTAHLGEPVHTGEYVYEDEKGETDGISIVGNNVIILESKNKPLTRAARSGDLAQLLLDLGGSFIESQKQALRTEAALRKGPLMLFAKNSDLQEMKRGTLTPIARIEAPADAIYIRLSCSPVFYGVFNENIVCRNVVQALLGRSFVPSDPKLDKKFNEFEHNLNQLEGLINLLQQEAYPSKRLVHLMHGSSFLSFGLIYLLTSPTVSKKHPIERLEYFRILQSSDYDTYSLLKYLLQ